MGRWEKFVESIKNADVMGDSQDAVDLVDDGDLEKALLYVNEKLKAKPKSAGLLFTKGTILDDMERPYEALECYDKVLEINPDDENAIYNKVVIQISATDKIQEGLNTLKLLPKERQNETSFLRIKADALVELEKFKESEKICEEILKKEPDDTFTLMIYTNSCYARKNYERALELTNKILEIIPTDINTQNNKADLLNHLGRSEESLKISESIISRNSMNEEAWANKGVSLIKMSDYENAINSLQTAIQIDSAFAEVWFHLARAYAYANNEDDALDSLVVSTSLEYGHNQLEDSSFDNIKNHSRFQKLVSKQKDQVN